MKYPAYPKYKDSGVAWLGAVPADWEVKKVKYLAKVKIGITYSPDDIADESDGVLVLRASNVQNGKLSFHDNVFVSNKINSDDFVRTGDILICSRNGSEHLVGKCAYIDSTNVGYTFGAFMSIVRSNIGLFLYYFFNSEVFKAQSGLFKTSTINQLTTNTLENLMVALPSSSEQTAIADFLYSETGRIDTLVAKKRKLVALLREKRSALISRTVTRGLPADAAREFGLTTGNTAVHEAPTHYGRGDFNRPQAEANEFAPTDNTVLSQASKDSGVEWLGEISEHWQIVPLGFLVSIKGGATPDKSNAEYWEGEIPWVSPKDMKVSKIADAQDHISIEALRNSSVVLLPRNSVLIVVRGMILAHSFPVAITIEPVTINQDMKALICGNRLAPSFLTWFLMGFSKAIVSLADESAHGTRKLETETLTSFPVLLPPLQEQTAIATYLDRETAKIDRLVAKVETAIARLQEYRSALITAAVTGKIDVREAL